MHLYGFSNDKSKKWVEDKNRIKREEWFINDHAKYKNAKCINEYYI